jgi:DNA-binding NtrC family response regulator
MMTSLTHTNLRSSRRTRSPKKSSPAVPTVWIVEDESKWQDAFSLLVGMAFTNVHIQHADCAEKTQNWLTLSAKQKDPQWADVVLMDWQLANGDDGLALVNAWVAQGLPAERVIIVSGADDVPLHPYTVVTKSQAGALLVPTLLQMVK